MVQVKTDVVGYHQGAASPLLLSIVVSIYNIREEIGRCLDSLVREVGDAGVGIGRCAVG